MRESRHHVGGVRPRPGQRRRAQVLQEPGHALALLRGNEEDAGEVPVRAELLLARQDPAKLRGLVDLVEHQDDGRSPLLLLEELRAGTGDRAGEPLRRRSAPALFGGRPQAVPQLGLPYDLVRADLPHHVEDLLVRALHHVDHEEAHVALLVAPPSSRDQLPVGFALVRRDDARNVNEHQLHGPHGLDATQAVACRVHLGRHSADRALQDGIHERRLSRVGRARQSHAQ
mmetsp:Transcript_15130/g.46920  ORF Transcript_15130/g.46920 Transcript_15130/m.46920 type:complete len:229 (+) Transcript_15130:325-1011(+)